MPKSCSRSFGLILSVSFFVLAPGGCDDDSPSGGQDATTDGAVDGSMPDGFTDGGPDGGGDGGEPFSTCTTPVVLDTDFELDPAGPDTQIHVQSRFDGEAVWLVYNLPNTEGFFDVYGARLNCDGTPRFASTKLNTAEGGNSVDPGVAVAGQDVFVVWGRDNNQGVDNMDAFYRSFTVDGTPLMAEDQSLETTYDGTPVAGNVMFPTVTPHVAGSFVVAGSRALEETSTFQVFVQEVSAEGALISEARNGSFEPGVTQLYPSVATLEPDVIHLAWASSTTTEDETVVQTYFTGDATEPQVSPPVEARDGLIGASSSLCAAGTGAEQRLYLAVGAQNGAIVLKDGLALDPSSTFVQVGDAWELDHSPVVACHSGGGGVVVFYRNVSGLDNRVIAQPFSYDGSTFELGTEVVVSEGPAAPYQPAVTHIGEDVYFAAWSEGQSPDFRLKGRFFQAASP
jgi:hypothetical protein